jgi:carbon catabolite-derepressing protein kinase
LNEASSTSISRLTTPPTGRRYEVITTPTDIIMVIEYAGGELFDYIVQVRRPTPRARVSLLGRC